MSRSLQLYIDRYIDLYVCKYMIYHCIHWWTMAFYVDIYVNFCFINICLIPISTNFVVVFIHVSTCNFINIRWNPIFVDFFVELIHEIDFSLMGDFCNDKSIGCIFTYIYHWNCNFHVILENWCIWILMKIHVLWILRLCMFHCMIHTLQVFLGWFLCLKYRYIYFTLKKVPFELFTHSIPFEHTSTISLFTKYCRFFNQIFQSKLKLLFSMKPGWSIKITNQISFF